MTKKHSKHTTDQPDPNELDPPPPYSPQELPGSSQPAQAPSLQPSAPTAEDVDFADPENQIYQDNENLSREPVAQQGGVTNYGSIANPTTAGDVQPQSNTFNRLGYYWSTQGDQYRAQAAQQREQAAHQRAQAALQREQAARQREQAVHQSARARQVAGQERAQAEQTWPYSNISRNTGDTVRSLQVAGINGGVSIFRKGAKKYYSPLSQSEAAGPVETQDQSRMQRRNTVKKSLCFFVAIAIALVFLGLGLYYLLNDTNKQDPPLIPQPPANTSSSSASHTPSKTTSKSPSGPSSPTPPSTTPIPTGIPSDIPNFPGDPPNDGSSCGPGCIISSYNWAIDDHINAFRLLATGALTSGNVLVMRSPNSGPGSISLVLELKGVDKKDISFYVVTDDGMTVYLSTPSNLSIWSSIRVKVVIQLPDLDESVFQIFQCLINRSKIVLSDVNGSFRIPKLDVRGTNARVEVSPLFITTDTQLIQTSNGDIIGSLKSSAGKSMVQTTNGNIRLQGTGQIYDIETTNGNIDGAYNCSNKCLFKTTNGKVSLSQIDTPNMVIDNRNGAIDIQDATSVANLVASTSNEAIRLRAVSLGNDPTILLIGTNGLIDCYLPMDYQGGFVAETSKGQSATVKMINPSEGHSLKFKVATSNYVSGNKISPSSSSQGALRVNTKNANINIQFVS
ncbi:hypothetical protein VKS41_008998 [Umbelopsis sp. WA50703]